MESWPSAEHCMKKHIRRFEFATKADRRPEFRVPPIRHLRSLYSCPLTSLTYTTPHSREDAERSLEKNSEKIQRENPQEFDRQIQQAAAVEKEKKKPKEKEIKDRVLI